MVLVTSFIGALFNSLLAIQLFALWRSLRRDSESEWEGSLDPWTVNTLSLLGGLSAAYFVTAAVASAIGFTGIVKVSRFFPLSNPLYWAPTKRVLSRFAGNTGLPPFLSRFLRRRLHVLHHLYSLRDIRLLQLLLDPLRDMRRTLATCRSHARSGRDRPQPREL